MTGPHTTFDLAIYREAVLSDGTALIVWDIDTDALAFDEAEGGAFGARLEQTIADGSFRQLAPVHPDDRAMLAEHFDMLKQEHPELDGTVDRRSFTCRFLYADGAYLWCEVQVAARFEDGRARRALTTLRNIDAEYRRREAIRNRAELDPLTGVCNKMRAYEVIDAKVREPNAKGLLIAFDLDNFKEINDTLGHLVGDAVLSDMALTLKSTFRAHDVVGRIGGDEFVVYVDGDLSDELVAERCERVRKVLRRSLENANTPLQLSCSVGIAHAPADGTSYDELFARADATMYAVKSNGRDGQLFYTPDIALEQLDPEAELVAQTRERAFVEHPVDFIFNMLFDTKDAKMTAKILLELFAKYFEVQRVFVYQRNPDMSWSCFFEWHVDEVAEPFVAHAGVVTDFINASYEFTPTGVFCELRTPDDAPDDIAAVLRTRGIHAFLHAGIMDGDDKFGCVGFDDCVHERVWTAKEHEVLKAFADIIGAYLVIQANAGEEIGTIAHVKTILETMNRSVAVTDAETGALVFLNGYGRRALGVAADASELPAACVLGEGFPVEWEDGRESVCHVLD